MCMSKIVQDFPLMFLIAAEVWRDISISCHQIGGMQRPYLFTGWVRGQAKTGRIQSILQTLLHYLAQ